MDAVSGGGLDAIRLVSGATAFDVDLWIRLAGSAYMSYQASLNYNPAILAWVPVGTKGWTYSGLGGMTNNVAASAKDQLPVDTVNDSSFGGSAAGDVITDIGVAATVHMQCVGNGTSPLHLITLVEDVAFGTSTIDADANWINTGLTDASVTCQDVPGSPPAESPIVSLVRLLGAVESASP